MAGVRDDLEARQGLVSLERLKERCRQVDPAIDPMPRFRGPGVAVIAEVKMGSPRLGSLHGRFDPIKQAQLYAQYMLRRFGPDALSRMLAEMQVVARAHPKGLW